MSLGPEAVDVLMLVWLFLCWLGYPRGYGGSWVTTI
jgi:hypothetical protein